MQKLRHVVVGSVAALEELLVMAQRMMVLAFVVKRDQLGSFCSLLFLSSMYCCWKRSAILAMVRVNCGSVEKLLILVVGGGGVWKTPGSWAGWMVSECCWLNRRDWYKISLVDGP